MEPKDARTRDRGFVPVPAHPLVVPAARRRAFAVLVALLPVLGVATFAAGRRALAGDAALAARLLEPLHTALGSGGTAPSAWASVAAGLAIVLPMFAVAIAVDALVARGFARARRRPSEPATALAALLFASTLPPETALLDVAVGMLVGSVVAREIFGGSQRSFVHPAVLGHVFLAQAWPRSPAGRAEWLPDRGLAALATADGGSGAALDWSALARVMPPFEAAPLAAASCAACLAGGCYLLARRLLDLATVAGATAGVALGATLLREASTRALGAALPWPGHFALGSLAFGVLFLAAEPAGAARSRAGRLLAALLAGFLVVLFRVADARRPDGTLAALLLASCCAPLLDVVARACRLAPAAGSARHG